MVAARTSSIPSARSTVLGNGRQRGEQQDDPQVRVGADDPPGCLDRVQHGAADSGGGRLIERLGDRHRAQEEIDEMQPGQIGVPVHVSRLAGGDFQQAGDLRQLARAQAAARVTRSCPDPASFHGHRLSVTFPSL